MKENSNDYIGCINLAIENAQERMRILEGEDKNSLFKEYKEWFNDGVNYHSVLLLREDPII